MLLTEIGFILTSFQRLNNVPLLARVTKCSKLHLQEDTIGRHIRHEVGKKVTYYVRCTYPIMTPLSYVFFYIQINKIDQPSRQTQPILLIDSVLDFSYDLSRTFSRLVGYVRPFTYYSKIRSLADCFDEFTEKGLSDIVQIQPYGDTASNVQFCQLSSLCS